ncbi:SDR family NAD(P)-dependent oxidoreductase [Zooshikella sp. RANM57]|uniref:SDR family NAD(P)-dependent oxidoreductase n=1 Tax=Zooshikella sp. RANM57 TaxID=3425863 RepID=UPI003D6FEF7D
MSHNTTPKALTIAYIQSPNRSKAQTESHISQKQWQQLHDSLLLESTERCKAEPNFSEYGEIMPGCHWLSDDQWKEPFINEMQTFLKSAPRTLFKPRKCYVCKVHFFNVHHFYHSMCPDCAYENYRQRSETADLTGRIALVTGGRIKIGYEITLKLLRAGSTVLVTSRFKYDAACRFINEPDYDIWKHRLHIYGLDLKHIPSVEAFINYVGHHYSALDIIINNAAQTNRKPHDYYMAMANNDIQCIAKTDHKLLGAFVDKQLNNEIQKYLQDKNSPLIKASTTVKLDEFNEPIDVSSNNSWTKTIDNVDTLEFLETQTINVTSPFLINSRLKPLLLNSTFKQKFIVNVSAMEGQFNRKDKTHRHPHTNMAKAALNMMTRTVAKDYVNDNIYMTSVDTGWVTQENPFPIKIKNRAKGVVPPLDCVDGASRVLSPVFDAVNGKPALYGCFLKDYQICSW